MKDVIRIVVMLILILLSMVLGMFIIDKLETNDFRFTIPWFIGFINFPMIYYMTHGLEGTDNEKKD